MRKIVCVLLACVCVMASEARGQIAHVLAGSAAYFEEVDAARRAVTGETVDANATAAVDALAVEVAGAVSKRLEEGYPFDLALREAVMQMQVYGVAARVRGSGLDLEVAARETVATWLASGITRKDVLRACVNARMNKLAPYCRALPTVFPGVEQSLDGVETMRGAMAREISGGTEMGVAFGALRSGGSLETVREALDRRAAQVALKGYGRGAGITTFAVATANELRAGGTVEEAVSSALERLSVFWDAGITSSSVDWRADLARSIVVQGMLKEWQTPKQARLCLGEKVDEFTTAALGAFDAGLLRAAEAFSCGDHEGVEGEIEKVATPYRGIVAGLALRAAMDEDSVGGGKAVSSSVMEWAVDADAQSVVRARGGKWTDGASLAAEAMRQRRQKMQQGAGRK